MTDIDYFMTRTLPAERRYMNKVMNNYYVNLNKRDAMYEHCVEFILANYLDVRDDKTVKRFMRKFPVEF